MSEQGVPAQLLVGEDHIQVRAGLVEYLGGGNEALVFHRIEYRTRHVAYAHEHDGMQWWEVTKPELARETGLTVSQIETAVKNLLAKGAIRAEQHSLPMQTMSYAALVVQSGDLRIGNRESPDSSTEIPGLQTGDLRIAPIAEEAQEAEDERVSPDVRRLCALLADLVRANGHRVGVVGATWWQACDRLMRLDGLTAEQVEILARWATADEFWAVNVRSMPALRKHLDQIRAQRNRQLAKRANVSTIDHGRTVDALLAQRERAAAGERLGVTA